MTFSTPGSLIHQKRQIRFWKEQGHSGSVSILITSFAIKKASNELLNTCGETPMKQDSRTGSGVGRLIVHSLRGRGTATLLPSHSARAGRPRHYIHAILPDVPLSKSQEFCYNKRIPVPTWTTSKSPKTSGSRTSSLVLCPSGRSA